MGDELTDRISEAARGPKSASVDGVSVEQQPIRDLIKADQYLEGKKAAKKASMGLRFGRIVPPGSV
ncbi:MAG TPA: hypothetical protein VGP72_31660 [Planctomycetota bacterium]|jgi:hypothetical protein